MHIYFRILHIYLLHAGLSYYEGEYQHNQFHGRGRFECEDGRQYTGEFQRGGRQGQGTQRYVVLKDDIAGQLIVNRLIEYTGGWVGLFVIIFSAIME